MYGVVRAKWLAARPYFCGYSQSPEVQLMTGMIRNNCAPVPILCRDPVFWVPSNFTCLLTVVSMFYLQPPSDRFDGQWDVFDYRRGLHHSKGTNQNPYHSFLGYSLQRWESEPGYLLKKQLWVVFYRPRFKSRTNVVRLKWFGLSVWVMCSGSVYW